MKKKVLSTLMILVSLTGCTQLRQHKTAVDPTSRKIVNSIPFLRKTKDFVYVNKDDLEPINEHVYVNTSLYTPTGYAVVENLNRESSVIDEEGREIIKVKEGDIELSICNGLTFYKMSKEYEKKMPIWKWEWNILGGAIKKEQTYKSIEIGVLDTNQVLLKKEFPYLEDSYGMGFYPAGDQSVFWNGTLYEITNKKLKKKESNILDFFKDNRYIQGSRGVYTLYSLDSRKALHRDLKGVDSLSIGFAGEMITAYKVNAERYTPELPKVLLEPKTNNVYVYPQYDKAFPKEIKVATSTQIDFIKRTELVYSIDNSPYFLLGVFNYDHDIWAYDWLYIDTEGKVLDDVYVDHFKISDQVGNLVWPKREHVLVNKFVDTKYSIGKISYLSNSNELFLVNVMSQDEKRTIGIWSKEKQEWEIEPEYSHVTVLDSAKGIYALRKKNDDLYVLFDNFKRKEIGVRAYKYITSEGLVQVKLDDELISYYIDIYTGKEYLEQ